MVFDFWLPQILLILGPGQLSVLLNEITKNNEVHVADVKEIPSVIV